MIVLTQRVELNLYRPLLCLKSDSVRYAILSNPIEVGIAGSVIDVYASLIIIVFGLVDAWVSLITGNSFSS